MNVYLENLGCVRNQVDGELMLGLLRNAGWQVVDEPEDATLIVVNTCGFIEPAVNESIDTILALAAHKTEGRCRSLIVAGCLPERFGESLADELPEVDLFLGTGAYDRIVEAAENAAMQRCVLPSPEAMPVVLSGERVRTDAHLAYVKVAEGCSRHCTYCIIPKLRGRQRSRPIADIVAECRSLIDAGTRELVLVAQDTTDYGGDLDGVTNLADLLGRVADLSPDIWLRVLYGHPESITEATVRVMAERPNVCAYFDLPVQHASNAVLRRMGRGHSKADLLRLFEMIRRYDPNAALRTTVITGFPGETDADFAELLDFVETVRFDHLGAFVYSDADDLPSHRLPDHVPLEVAEARRDRLMEVQQAISEAKNETYLDAVLPVIIDEAVEPAIYAGRTIFQAPEVDGMVHVHFDGEAHPGDVVKVRIVDAMAYDLVGHVV